MGLTVYTLQCSGPNQVSWIQTILQLFKSHRVNIRHLVWIETFEAQAMSRLEVRFELANAATSFIPVIEQFLEQCPEIAHQLFD